MKMSPDGRRLPNFRLILLAAAIFALPIAAAIFASPAVRAAPGDSSIAARNPAGTTVEPSRYVGPGGCAATSCHGSVKPLADTRIFQNEYSIWVVQDKHSRAYNALTSPIGERIGRILGIGKSEEAPKCLACHALDVAPEARAKTFDLSDGVSCESCHGPASAWLGPHTTRGWTHAQSVAAGMYDTRDLVQRTEKCLTCHLGTQEKFVDHEMLAAGHPDLYFELDSFSAVMPRHWKTPRESAPGVPEAGADDPWFGVRDWATGQAVQLRAALDRVAWRAHGTNWPEFSELQCFSCHHDLTMPEQSWRQERGYPGRRPGDPPWNASRYAVFAILAHEVDGPTATELDAQMTQLAKQMSVLNPDRDAVASTAASARALADRLVARIQAQPYDRALTERLLIEISSHGEEISGQGERAAEQAAMALDSLYIASSRNAQPANAADIRAAINGLFQLLENPSAYDPNTFAAQMTKVNALLR
jgi:hypothetical protein